MPMKGSPSISPAGSESQLKPDEGIQNYTYLKLDDESDWKPISNSSLRKVRSRRGGRRSIATPGQRVLARLQAKNQLTKWMKKALAKPDVASDKLNELIDADFSKLRKHDEEWEVEPQEDDIDIEDLPEIFTTDKEFLSKWGETHQQVTQQTKEVFGNIGESEQHEEDNILEKLCSDHVSYLERKAERMKEYEARRERLRTEREQYLESNLSMLEEREWSSEDNDSYCKINPELIAVSPLNRFSVDLRTMVHNTRPMALTEISEPEENSRMNSNLYEESSALPIASKHSDIDTVISSINRVVSTMNSCIARTESITNSLSTDPDINADMLREMTELSRALITADDPDEAQMSERIGSSKKSSVSRPSEIGRRYTESNKRRREDYTFMMEIYAREDHDWNSFYEHMCQEYFMLKAMQTGRCDDADAFDRKVFVFDMEPGPCPISWREMFAMARFKLQELVCYPYANEEQLKWLMKMENDNIYTIWQTEIMNKIREKLVDITKNIKDGFHNKIQNALKTRLVKTRWKRFAQTSAPAEQASNKPKRSIKEESNYNLISESMRPSSRGKISKQNDVQKCWRDYIANAHSEFKDDDAFNKALKRVKHKRFVSDGLKNIPKHRKKLLDKLNTDKILENKDTSSGDKSQWRDEGHRQRSTTETEGTRSRKEKLLLRLTRKWPHIQSPTYRVGVLNQFTRYHTLLVDKQTQSTRLIIVMDFLKAGFTWGDLQDRHCPCTNLDVSTWYSFPHLRAKRWCFPMCRDTSVKYENGERRTSQKTERLPTLFRELVTQMGQMSELNLLVAKRLAQPYLKRRFQPVIMPSKPGLEFISPLPTSRSDSVSVPSLKINAHSPVSNITRSPQGLTMISSHTKDTQHKSPLINRPAQSLYKNHKRLSPRKIGPLHPKHNTAQNKMQRNVSTLSKGAGRLNSSPLTSPFSILSHSLSSCTSQQRNSSETVQGECSQAPMQPEPILQCDTTVVREFRPNSMRKTKVLPHINRKHPNRLVTTTQLLK